MPTAPDQHRDDSEAALCRTRSVFFVLALLVAVCCGCDEAVFESAPEDAQPSSYQSQAIRGLVTHDGLEALYEAAFDDGARLQHDAVDIGLFDEEVALGPLDDRITSAQWTVSNYQNEFEVTLSGEEIATTVPVRIGSGANSRLCRFGVEIAQVEATNRLELVAEDGHPALATVDVPSAELTGPSVDPIGTCDELDEVRDGLDDEDFDQIFVDYLTNAWSRSVARMSQTSLLEALGLIGEPMQIRRLSNFENRRGSLILDQRSSAEGGGAASRGAEFALDAAATGRRADCAPPLDLGNPDTGAADEISSSILDDAHVGLSLAEPFLARLLRTGALSGFACGGLEDVTFDGNGATLAADDLDLERVGLDETPIGATVAPVTRPGTAPDLETDADNDVLRITWDALSVDLYAQVQQMPVPLVTATTDLELAFRPVEGTNAIELSLSSIEVLDASLASHWFDEPPADDALVRDWSERLLVLVLDDALTIPLPLEPASPLRLADARVRTSDLLLTFDIEH